jgi:hypothetical protein
MVAEMPSTVYMERAVVINVAAVVVAVAAVDSERNIPSMRFRQGLVVVCLARCDWQQGTTTTMTTQQDYTVCSCPLKKDFDRIELIQSFLVSYLIFYR